MRWQRWMAIGLYLGLCAAAVCALAGLGRAADTADEALRGQFRQLVFAERRPADLQPRLMRRGEQNGLLEERVRIVPEAEEEAVVLLLRAPDPPASAAPSRRPTVLVQHFLGGSKDETTIRMVMLALARQGFLAAAIDGRYRGERQRGKSLNQAIAEALETGKGHPWLLDTVFDVLRTLDYLVTRPDVDPERVGILGVSEGGMIAWMAAACDERLRAVIPMVAVTRFQDLVDLPLSGGSQPGVELLRPALTAFARQLGEPEVNARVWRAAWEKLLPGCCDRFEATRLVPTIAPRPLLILNHEQDELIPIAGARAVYEATRDRYRDLHVEDRLQFRVAPGLKHAATDLAELLLIGQWLQRWLKPTSGDAAGPQ
ncbi:MAG: dienelactone hydrolase family protein [Armatimonadetes bacterium]|nr:dienelactone hydrolase family protein [Armatimonadota bacterium]